MSEAPSHPPDPETSQMRRRVREARAAATEFAKTGLEEFKERGPFFQAKVGVVAAYVFLVLLTLALAPPGKDAWLVRQTRLSFGLSFKTALEIENADNGDLKDVVVVVSGEGIEFDGRKVPGTWRTKPLAMPEGVTIKLLAEQLYDDAGHHPPYSLVIHSVQVVRGKKVLLDTTVAPVGP